MKQNRALIASAFAAVALIATGVPASGSVLGEPPEKSRSDQGEARKEMRAGNQLSLREIERRILPKMAGSEYLGPAYDATARAYRLKFIKDGRVTYVDVDARTGKIINRSR